jgi:hypothetical protein
LCKVARNSGSSGLSVQVMESHAAQSLARSGPAFSQGAPQTLTLMKVDPQSLATGYRTSKVVGSTVINEANEKVPFAVLSVGGFLGMGAKYVVCPTAHSK